MTFSASTRRRLLSLAPLVFAAATLLLVAPRAGATAPDLGTPYVYRALVLGFEAESFDPVGLRIQRLGSPPSSARVLTEDPSDTGAALSPDGRWIAFTRRLRDPGESSGRGALFLIRTDGSGLRQLTDPAAGVNDTGPSFGPSGRRLVFARTEDETVRGTNQGDIYSVGVDGTGLHQITSGRAADSSPAISPSGRQIVFARHTRTQSISDIYSVRPDGSRLRNLTPLIPARHRLTERIAAASQPTFSPSGRVIAFRVSANGGENIDTMRPNGSHIRSLTGVGRPPLSRRFHLSEPEFSPSGRSLLVTARDSYHCDLALISLADRSTLFTPGTPQGESPAW